MNREGIRRLAAEELDLPTSRYAFAESLNQLQVAIDGGIGYPCIVKPVMSSSGKGQSTIKGPDDIAKAWDYALSGGRVSRARVIVEEMIRFDYEITLLTVRALGSTGQVETTFCEPIGHIQVKGDYVESWQPQPMSPKALKRAQEIAGLITGNLGGRGIFGVELFVKGDQVWFSEVSPRPHDTGMVTMITQAQNEFELHAAPSWACLFPRRCAIRAPARSFTAASTRAASLSMVWPRPYRSKAPNCVCSASRRPSFAGAWAWPWRRARTSPRRVPGPRRQRGKCGRWPVEVAKRGATLV